MIARRLPTMRLAAILLAAMAAWIAAPRDALAIPAFARRYQTACSTCHVQYPKLNAYGDAFRRNGYQLPGGADLEGLRQEPLVLVPEERRALFPSTDFPSDLTQYPPIAIWLRGEIPIYPDAATRPKGTPAISFSKVYGGATVLIGARLFEDVSIFGEAGIATTGAFLGRAFVSVSNLFTKSVLNVRAGQFEPQIFSFSSYRQIAGPAYWIVTLAPPIGAFTLEPYVRGIDVSGTLGGRVGYDAAWVQGVEGAYGAEPAVEAPRDGYAHLYVKLGGARLDGLERPGLLSGRVDRWVQIGAFGYAGVHDALPDADAAAMTMSKTPPPTQRDVLYKTGGDVNARIGPVELLLAAAWEHHDFEKAGTGARAEGLAEITVRVFPWLVAGLRGEDEATVSGFARRRITPMLSVHPRINLKTQAWVSVEENGALYQGFHVTEIHLGASAAL
jgi:hypothetical protein